MDPVPFSVFGSSLGGTAAGSTFLAAFRRSGAFSSTETLKSSFKYIRSFSN